VGKGKTLLEYRKRKTVFAQGDSADAVFYVQKGRVKLSVASAQGKEAVIAIMGPGDFLGEGCLAGQPLRLATATSLTECSLVRVEKKAVVQLLHTQSAFSEFFISYLLGRNLRIQEDLIDQLSNSSEKRLARLLLLLANFGKDGKSEPVIPKISQETLAEMVGTTRSRVNHFMNKFRKLGFIKYDRGLEVHSSLLTVVLHQEGTERP
jgi:CRP/FNR family transcriptional regulator, cyclic AMP receptor protein